MLEIRALSVTYPDGTKALDDLNLTINDGERVALIGANGAGKTTLTMALVGILPSTGDVLVDGVRLDKSSAGTIRAKVGVVFQNPDDQLFMPSVYEDVAFGPRNLGLDEAAVEARVRESLAALGIERLRERTALKLSGGEKRMAAVAAVLAMEPSLLVFDEPTAFLDPKARRNLIHVLDRLGRTQLIATHDLPFAAQACGRAVLLKGGRLFADGPSDRLLYDGPLMDACGVEAIERKE